MGTTPDIEEPNKNTGVLVVDKRCIKLEEYTIIEYISPGTKPVMLTEHIPND